MKPNQKTDLIYLKHMLDCISRIEEYTHCDRKTFFDSRIIQDAVIRNLQILAESSQRLSQAIKSSAPQVPWRAISGFRNILVHDYLGLDMEAIWIVVESELPALKEALNNLIRRIS